jgi:hypothetical protein
MHCPLVVRIGDGRRETGPLGVARRFVFPNDVVARNLARGFFPCIIKLVNPILFSITYIDTHMFTPCSVPLESSRLPGRKRESKRDSGGTGTAANTGRRLVLGRIVRRDDATRAFILDTDIGFGHHSDEYRRRHSAGKSLTSGNVARTGQSTYLCSLAGADTFRGGSHTEKLLTRGVWEAYFSILCFKAS